MIHKKIKRYQGFKSLGVKTIKITSIAFSRSTVHLLTENKEIRGEKTARKSTDVTIICRYLTKRTSNEHIIACFNWVYVSLLIKLHEFWLESLIYIVSEPRKNLSHVAHWNKQYTKVYVV